MARTQEWNCLRQIQWVVNQEYKQCWMPPRPCKVKGQGVVLDCDKRSSETSADAPRDSFKDRASKVRLKIAEEQASGRAGSPCRSFSGAIPSLKEAAPSVDGFKDVAIAVVVRTELFAPKSDGQDVMRVDFAVKKDVCKEGYGVKKVMSTGELLNGDRPDGWRFLK